MESTFTDDTDDALPEGVENIEGLDLGDDNEEFESNDDEEFEDTDAWHADLEDALLEGYVDQSMIKSICQSRILPARHRTEVWKICLNIASRGDPLNCWDGKLDLPEQSSLHEACVKIVEKMGLERSESTIADLESVVTFYAKSRAIVFDEKNAWLELLQPLVALGDLTRANLYNCFYAILTRYIPKDQSSDAPYDLFRHLLMYHDPELCCFLDSKKVAMQAFMKPWFSTMFASRCKKEVTQSLWDIYFQEADPYFGVFLSLVVLVNAKEQILSMEKESKDEILKSLTQFPSALEVVDIEDFCQLAMYFRSKTPQSAFRRYQTSIFGGMLLNSQKGAVKREDELAQSLCLQVSTEDIFTLEDSDPQLRDHTQVKFFLVDCRPPDFYNDGHLHSAYHLDATLMLREPKEFTMAIESLFVAQKQAIEAGNSEVGEHLCLIGSGDKDEDQHLHMTIAYLLKNHHVYVSVVHGGFDAVVTYLTQANVKLSDWLTGTTHRRERKHEEYGRQSQSDSGQSDDPLSDTGVMEGFMKSLTTTIKSKSQDIKSKVSKFMDNDQGKAGWNSSKPYRGTQPIFSIGGEEEQGTSSAEDREGNQNRDEVDEKDLKTLEQWMALYNLENVYPCFKVLQSGKRPNVCIAVKDDELICLKEYKKKGKFGLISSRPLSCVAKITSKRSCSELITFRFQIPSKEENEDGVVEEIAERYFIPDAGIVMKQIKQQIMRVLENSTEKKE